MAAMDLVFYVMERVWLVCTGYICPKITAPTTLAHTSRTHVELATIDLRIDALIL